MVFEGPAPGYQPRFCNPLLVHFHMGLRSRSMSSNEKDLSVQQSSLHTLVWLTLMMSLALFGCGGGDDTPQNAAKTSCDSEASEACRCTNGLNGTRACSDSLWGDCVCLMSTTSADAGNTSADDATIPQDTSNTISNGPPSNRPPSNRPSSNRPGNPMVTYCEEDADCDDVCPQQRCVCMITMGRRKTCVPTCETAADCPVPMEATLRSECQDGFCTVVME